MTDDLGPGELDAVLLLHALVGPVAVLGGNGAPPMAECPACGRGTPVAHDGHSAYCLPCTLQDEHRRLTTPPAPRRPVGGRKLTARGPGDARRASSSKITGAIFA